MVSLEFGHCSVLIHAEKACTARASKHPVSDCHSSNHINSLKLEIMQHPTSPSLFCDEGNKNNENL